VITPIKNKKKKKWSLISSKQNIKG
jgi:hypothetical protein